MQLGSPIPPKPCCCETSSPFRVQAEQNRHTHAIPTACSSSAAPHSLLLTDESLQCRLGGGVAATEPLPSLPPQLAPARPSRTQTALEAAVRASQQARVYVAVTKRIVLWESNLEEKHPDLPQRSLHHHRHQSSSSLSGTFTNKTESEAPGAKHQRVGWLRTRPGRPRGVKSETRGRRLCRRPWAL